MDGIHGPEIQFLGRSLPVTTGIVPYASALAGGVVGARMGASRGKAASRGLVGGMAGLAVGQVAGNIIEKTGAWFSYDNVKIGQGRENSKNYLKENNDVLKSVVEKVKAFMGLGK